MSATEEKPKTSQEAFEQALAGRLLEGRQASSAALTASEVREGVSYQRLEAFARRLDLTQTTLTRVLGASERTLQRRKRSGRLSAAESDRFERLRRAWQRALRAFDDDAEEARHWLTTPKRALGGETPVEHLDTEPGARAVAEMLVVIDQTIPA